VGKGETRFDVVCIGSATQDVFVRSDAASLLTLSGVKEHRRLLCFDYGAKISVEHIEFTTGGGATNTASSFASLGARSAFLGQIGAGPQGKEVLKELEAHGVDISYHLCSAQYPTGYSVILTSFEGDRTVLTHRGASTELAEGDIDWSFLDKTDWVYVTSLSGRSGELIGPLADRASAAGVRLAVNPGSTQLALGLEGLGDLLGRTEVLLLNKEEASRLTGKEPIKDVIIESKCTLCGKCIEACPHNVFVRDGDHVAAAGIERCVRCGACLPACPERAIVMEPWSFNVAESFQVLCAAGPKVVSITDGVNGVQACDGEQIWMLPAHEVPTASSLGAGDAFGSAFVFEYRRSGDLGRALALGSANAASVVQQIGAKNGLLNAAEADAALEGFDPGTVRRYTLGEALEALGS